MCVSLVYSYATQTLANINKSSDNIKMLSHILSHYFTISDASEQYQLLEALKEDYLFCLFKVIEDFSGELYFEKGALLLPLSYSELKVRHKEEVFSLSSSQMLTIAEGTYLTVTSLTPSGQFALFSISEKLLYETAKIYSVPKKEFVAPFDNCHLLTRELWLHELINRLSFALFTEKNSQNYASEFLKTEILKEVYNSYLWSLDPSKRDNFGIDYFHLEKLCPELERILNYIEKSLYKKICNEEIQKQFAVSSATLFRLFRRNLQTTPSAYIRDRKLREAHDLLRTSRYNVTEVANLLNFEHTSNFIHNFYKKYKIRPSAVIKKYR